MPESESLSAEIATLASKVFQMISENRLAAARDLIDATLDARELLTDDMKSVLSLYETTGLPKIAKLTLPRKRALRARMKEHPGYEWWANFFARVKRSDFLMGRHGYSRAWKATFDWLMNPTNMQKVIEGNYDPRGPGNDRQQLDANDEAAFRMSGVR